MKHIFNSLVQPHIDYCSQLCLPNKVGEMGENRESAQGFHFKNPISKRRDILEKASNSENYTALSTPGRCWKAWSLTGGLKQ